MADKIKRKMKIKSLKNIPLSILVALGIYYLSKFVNAPTESWFFLIVLLLLLIYFELLDKCKGK